MPDCFGERLISPFSKKKTFKMAKRARENRRNTDIILSFLAKKVDKHGITVVSDHLSALVILLAGFGLMFSFKFY